MQVDLGNVLQAKVSLEKQRAAAYVSIDKATLGLSFFECLVYDQAILSG